MSYEKLTLKKWCIDNNKEILLQEWDYEKNTISPNEISPFSNKKMWWICSYCQNTWLTTINVRATGSNCPKCAHVKQGNTNRTNNLQKKGSFEDWCNANRPELLQEWDYSKNTLQPNQVTAHSGMKVWWIGICEHSWESTISNRTKDIGSHCPICAKANRGKAISEAKLKKSGSFEEWCIKNNQKPLLIEWDYEKNSILPNEITPFSNKKVWWKCSNCNNTWSTTTNARCSGSNCPICALAQQGKKSITNKIKKNGSFEDWCKANNSDLLLEWDYEKNSILPNEVTKGSKNKIWWKCKLGHSFIQAIHSRTGMHTNCPYCYNNRFSISEKKFSYYLKQFFEIEENYRPSWLDGKEIDIYIPTKSIGIEYDGSIWHKDPNKDILKDELCKKNGIKLIHIREKGCPSLETSLCFCLENFSDNSFNHTIEDLLAYLGIHNSDIDVTRDTIKILEEIKLLENNNSLEKWCIKNNRPDILKFWSSKNGALSPSNISSHSSQKLWWTCHDCGTDWQAQVNSLTNGQGCPQCAHQKRIDGARATFLRKGTSLYDWCINNKSNLLQEWDYEKNEIQPTDVTYGSKVKVFWNCQKCNTSWSATINNRSRGQGCPTCGNIKRNEIMNNARLNKIKKK